MLTWSPRCTACLPTGTAFRMWRAGPARTVAKRSPPPSPAWPARHTGSLRPAPLPTSAADVRRGPKPQWQPRRTAGTGWVQVLAHQQRSLWRLSQPAERVWGCDNRRSRHRMFPSGRLLALRRSAVGDRESQPANNPILGVQSPAPALGRYRSGTGGICQLCGGGYRQPGSAPSEGSRLADFAAVTSLRCRQSLQVALGGTRPGEEAVINEVINSQRNSRGGAVTVPSLRTVGGSADRNATDLPGDRSPVGGLAGNQSLEDVTKRLPSVFRSSLVPCGRRPIALHEEYSIHDKSVWRHSTGQAATTQHSSGVEPDCRTGPAEEVAQCGWSDPGPEPA